MKITAQEEYGLRVLIRIASCKDDNGFSIPQISDAEGLTHHYVAKLTRLLRIGGFINSTPGYKGGYVLSRPADKIVISGLLKVLGGSLFDKSFCEQHSGNLKYCINAEECSSRSLWQMIQNTVDNFLDNVTLKDLITTERKSKKIFSKIMAQG